jgi:choline-sulfatase
MCQHLKMRRVAVCLILCAVTACAKPAPAPAPAARPNILLITIDTMRADRLGRGFTPALDRLAAQGLRFAEARTTVPLTLPAHTSIMTGDLPPAHGVRINGAIRPEGAPTLAALLKAAGYQTRAVVGAFVLDRRFGLDHGFDLYDDRISRDPDAMDLLQAERPAGAVIDQAIAMMATTSASEPWLLWVHLYDPHAPYEPPAPELARAKGVAYDGEIAYVDTEIARLLAVVDGRADAARTAVMVTGDHGESLGEHGEPTHGMLLSEPALRVPLIVRAPGVAAAERRDPASLIDIAPTALALAGLAGQGQGRNLLSPPPPSGIETYSETEYPRVAAWAPSRSLVRDGWKVVVSDRAALFNLADDGQEKNDLAAAQASLASAMAARLETIRAPAKGKAAAPATISQDTANRLRSLGYVTPAAASNVDGGINPAAAMPAWASFEAALSDLSAGRVSQSLPVLARVTAAYPASPIFAATYARALAAGGRKPEALARFRAAVARWPADASLYHELAVVARELGRAEEAMRAEEAALALNANEPMALNGKGLLLVEAGRHAEAATAFEAAAKADPTNAMYAANLGNALRELGQLDAAGAAYRRALDRAVLPDAANGLGVILVQQKQAAAAVPWLEQAAQDPSFVEAQLNLGIALHESGNAARARQQYQKVIAAAGSHPREKEAARALLAQLGQP